MKIKFTVLSAIILFCTLSVSFAQKDTAKQTYTVNPSFRVKTELVNLLELNPNIYFEYRTQKKLGFNLGCIYHLTGTIFSAPYRWTKDYAAIEWWNLKGFGADLGAKYYISPKKYFSLKCEAGQLSFNNLTLAVSERWQENREESLSRDFLHFVLIRGKEFGKKEGRLSEFFYGIGLLIAKEKYSYHYSTWAPITPEEHAGITRYAVPTFHFGFNFGGKWDKKGN